MKLGIISDTHGFLRAEVFEQFESVEHILHAGDIGPVDLLDELRTIAPVSAVWGNTDDWDVRAAVPEVAHVDINGFAVVVIHGHQFGSPTPQKVAAGFPDADLIVFGHSHRPASARVGSALALNPGSAGPPRFGSTPTLVVAELDEGNISHRLIQLDVSRK